VLRWLRWHRRSREFYRSWMTLFDRHYWGVISTDRFFPPDCERYRCQVIHVSALSLTPAMLALPVSQRQRNCGSLLASINDTCEAWPEVKNLMSLSLNFKRRHPLYQQKFYVSSRITGTDTCTAHLTVGPRTVIMRIGVKQGCGIIRILVRNPFSVHTWTSR
jgi:hypothetical protein